MKNELKQLLRDLKGAALLGQPEAIDIALNGLLTLPGVASNDRMESGFIEKAILPVGGLLQTLPGPQLRSLLNHHLAAGRAIGAVALAHLFIQGKNATQKDLRKPGNDSRLDVRAALGKALFLVGSTDPEKLLNLGTTWLMGAAPKLRHTALIFIPTLSGAYDTQIVGLLGPIIQDEDYDVRAELVAAVTTLAQEELAPSVLELLTLWGSESHPNSWVICRTLSGSWAAAHPEKVTALLQDLKSKTRESSHITGAVKALQRHGVEINLT
jgi:hypothetical protein